MRRFLLVLSLLAASVLLLPTKTNACGDKLLLLGRGVRFQALFGRPASILAFADGAGSNVFNDPEFQLALRKAGHKLQVVNNTEMLKQFLQSGHYDVVLANASDARAINAEAQLAPSRPVVMPVVYQGTHSQAQEAEKEFRCVMKAPGKGNGYLSSIDRALELKIRRDETKLQARK